LEEKLRKEEEKAQDGVNKVSHAKGKTYSEYLKLPELLSCQHLLSGKGGTGKGGVPAEHLFIVTHQAYELWFKQILFDLDRIRKLFDTPKVDESQTLKIVSGLDRIVQILKLLVDQVLILETMSPLDFVEFRKHLAPASGFQSLQFRLIENKLGIQSERRVRYNQAHYRNVFRSKQDVEKLIESENSPSLLGLVEKWLERTPGVDPLEHDFWKRYCASVREYLRDLRNELQRETTPDKVHLAEAEYEKTEKTFESILDKNIHQNLVEKGERCLSHEAMQGALMIYFYRDQPRFSQPYQIITYLMDIDSLLTKWRYNHVMLVQRMLGSKHGTGGSSGYMYLRSTVSDRYKVFLDLFNLSTWLIPRSYIPPLSPQMKRKLSHLEIHDENLLQVTPDFSDSE
jgi:tryptophan 2,3-dioxygenase